jgi:hypothetical protein
MENYDLMLRKFEGLMEEGYESAIQEQLNHPSMSDEVLGGTLLYATILNFSKNMKEDSLGNISAQYNLKISDLEDVIDKLEMKMLKKYFDNFKNDEHKDYDQLASDYEDYGDEPWVEDYGDEPWLKSEKPIVERKPTKKKTENNSLLIVFALVLLFGLGYYLFGDIISDFIKGHKWFKTNEMETHTAPQKNDLDSTLAYSQEGEWLSNNVNISEFSNGEKIFEASSKAEWEKACADKVPAYCHVNYDSSNDDKYGLLYNWYALTDERNICPEGYRLPKKSDFEILISDSIEKNRALNLKKNLPGYRDSDGYFKALDELLVIWSSEERFSNCVEALVISKDKIKMECYSPSQAYSIRFIKTDN